MNQAVLIVAMVGMLGCGGDEAPAGGDGVTQGTLTVAAQGVSGATGKIAVISVTAQGGGPLLGITCAQVTADPGSLSAVVRVSSGGNPCAGGAEVVFPNGSYAVSSGIYTPGSQTAEKCSRMTVTVDGDTTATLPAFGACN